MAKHDARGGPRICKGCGEWFDALGAEKCCPNEGCSDLAARIMKEAKAHEAQVKKNYTTDWEHGDMLQADRHHVWRAEHPPVPREDRPPPIPRPPQEVRPEANDPLFARREGVLAGGLPPVQPVRLEVPLPAGGMDAIDRAQELIDQARREERLALRRAANFNARLPLPRPVQPEDGDDLP